MTTPYRVSSVWRLPSSLRRIAESKISYQGKTYYDHSAGTKAQPLTIALGGTFQITSTTMKFYGPGKRVKVVVELEVMTREAGTLNVTRVVLTNVSVQGDTLTVKGPESPTHAGKSYRVHVTSSTNGLPDSYAQAGILKVNEAS